MNSIKLVVVDRDNVIIECPQGQYVLDKEKVALKKGIKDAFDLLKASEIKTCMATKQRCISKELITREQVDEINNYIESILDFKFDNIFVEPKFKLKTRILSDILNLYKLDSNCILYIDDNAQNCVIAEILGFQTVCSDNLLNTIQEWIIKF